MRYATFCKPLVPSSTAPGRGLPMTAVALLWLTAAAAFAGPPTAVPIADYGLGGAAVPEAAVAFLGDEFFSRNLAAELANGDNFSASLEIPKSIDVPFSLDSGDAATRLVRRKLSELRLTLELVNHADLPNDVVVSALDAESGAVRNFIVRAEPGESVRVDASSLADFERLFLLSMQRFSVTAEALLDGVVRRNFEPEAAARAPRVATKSGITDCDSSTPYCSECDQTVEICVEGTTNCIIAFAKRRFSHSSGSSDWYSVDIYYPSNSTNFHCYGSSTRVGGAPNCKNSTVRTSRCSDSSIGHEWDGIDDTLFNNVDSTAECTDGCTASFTVEQL